MTKATKDRIGRIALRVTGLALLLGGGTFQSILVYKGWPNGIEVYSSFFIYIAGAALLAPSVLTFLRRPPSE